VARLLSYSVPAAPALGKPAGYSDNSLVQFAQNLTGKFLLVHSTCADNVHFQNAIAFVDGLIEASKVSRPPTTPTAASAAATTACTYSAKRRRL
jgi:hypothetical protein